MRLYAKVLSLCSIESLITYLRGTSLEGVGPSLQNREDALHICAILKLAQRPHCRADLQRNFTHVMFLNCIVIAFAKNAQ